MRLGAVFLLAGEAACTAVNYDGPRLPRAEVARVGGKGTHINQMDDDRVDANYVEVLPGEHQLVVALKQPIATLPTGMGIEFRSTHDLTVCFTAYAGRFYEVRAAASVPYVHNHWRPAVFDYKAEVYVDHPCPVGRPRPVVLPPAALAKIKDESLPPGPPVPQAADPE